MGRKKQGRTSAENNMKRGGRGEIGKHLERCTTRAMPARKRFQSLENPQQNTTQVLLVRSLRSSQVEKSCSKLGHASAHSTKGVGIRRIPCDECATTKSATTRDRHLIEYLTCPTEDLLPSTKKEPNLHRPAEGSRYTQPRRKRGTRDERADGRSWLA